jgi:hypothetical protein
MDLGFSDHHAQTLSICTKDCASTPLKVKKRIFDKGRVEELQCNLKKELWKEVLLEPDVNRKLDVFVDIFRYYFDMCFLLKLVNPSRLQKKSWVTHGIKKSSKRLGWLNTLKKKMDLTEEEQVYIHKYRIVYRE